MYKSYVLNYSLFVQVRQAAGVRAGKTSCGEFASEPRKLFIIFDYFNNDKYNFVPSFYSEEPQKPSSRPARPLPASPVHIGYCFTMMFGWD